MRRLELGNLTQEDIQVRSGEIVSQGTVSDLERGKISIDSLNVKRASALARALKWSLSELQEATGVDLGVPNAEVLATSEPTPVYSLTALGTDKPNPDGYNITPSKGTHPAHWMQTFMDSDEMTPAIRDGESIYFDTDATSPAKGVYVIAHQGKAYIRRYSQLPTGPAWTADNPAYAHQFIPASDTVKVLGRVYRVVGIREDLALLN